MYCGISSPLLLWLKLQLCVCLNWYYINSPGNQPEAFDSPRQTLSGSPSGCTSYTGTSPGWEGAEMHWGALAISTALNCIAWSVTINLLCTE